MKNTFKTIINSFVILTFILFSSFDSQSGEKKPLTLDDILKIKSISDVSMSPDGNSILYVISKPDFKENVFDSDVWMVRIKEREIVQITRSPKRDYSPRFSPDSKLIAFLSDREEKSQIWIINPTGGEPYKLTSHKTGINSFQWFPESNKIAFIAQDPLIEEEEKKQKEKDDAYVVDKNLKMNHIWMIDLEKKEEKRITEGNFNVLNFSISSDEKEIIFSSCSSPTANESMNSDLFKISIEGGEVKEFIKRPGIDTSPKYSPDGEQIAFITTDGKYTWIGNNFLAVVNSKGGIPKNISKKFDEEVNAFWWHPNNKEIFFIAYQRMNHHLFKISLKDENPIQITKGDGFYSNFSFSEDFLRMAFIFQTPMIPPDLHVSELKELSPEKLTEVNPELKEFEIALTEIVKWKAKDGMEMEGLLVKPLNYKKDTKYPLLTIVHGGPAGVFSNLFAPRRGAYPIQTFTAEGYAVFMPNPRGSGGYGEKFRRANWKDWGYGDYNDIMSGIDYLVKIGIANPDKLGIMGWSYGGFMTSWVITQTNRFKAASVGAGVTHTISMYGLTDIPDFMEDYFGGKPWENFKEYEKHSALHYVKNVKTPTLIQHGEKDIRVPYSQGQEFYLALKKLGVPTEFVSYPRQPHGIQEPKLIKDSMKRNVDWFNRWILDKKE
ncbi:MAG: S9 family peptidase [Acidobacteriota bacterium]